MIMKQHIIILMLMLSFCLSCTNEQSPVNVEGYTFFTADMENISFGTLRKDLVWEEGSCIGVYGSEQGNNEKYFMRKSGLGQNIAEFYGYNVKGQIMAYSPYNEAFNGSAEELQLFLSPEQTLENDDLISQYMAYAPVACAVMKEGALSFHRPCGLLVVTFDFPENISVSSISVTTPNGLIAGRYSFMNDESVVASASAFNSIVLQCNGQGSRMADGSAVSFPIVLLPGDYDSLTLSVDVLDEEDFGCTLTNVQVKKMTDTGYPVTSVSFPIGNIDGFVPSDGYFEIQ